MTSVTSPRPGSPRSGFDLALIPQDRIIKRTLMPWSVHHSLATGKWIATITRTEYGQADRGVRRQQFSFRSEREARKFCKSYAPPRLRTGNTCLLCHKTACLMRHCRNCGVTTCDNCSTRWGAKMVPKTYCQSVAITQRVCRSCDWLSNAFCMALLQGRYQDALTLHDTGNVNLRTSFADIHQEAMFPVHCAVMGGSIEIVKWLVDIHLCPISVKNDPRGHMLSVQTSASRTLLDLAMTGVMRSKVDILVYLLGKGLSITDVKDSSLIPKTLETILKVGREQNMLTNIPMMTDGNENNHMVLDDDETDTALEDNACCLCYERPMDCVLTPCGHQMCCTDCGQQLTCCPMCKVQCSVLRVFRP